MRLVKLHCVNTNSDVWVNPEYILTVEDHSWNSKTVAGYIRILTLEGRSVDVEGPIEDVLSKLMPVFHTPVPGDDL